MDRNLVFHSYSSVFMLSGKQLHLGEIVGKSVSSFLGISDSNVILEDAQFIPVPIELKYSNSLKVTYLADKLILRSGIAEDGGSIPTAFNVVSDLGKIPANASAYGVNISVVVPYVAGEDNFCFIKKVLDDEDAFIDELKVAFKSNICSQLFVSAKEVFSKEGDKPYGVIFEGNFHHEIRTYAKPANWQSYKDELIGVISKLIEKAG